MKSSFYALKLFIVFISIVLMISCSAWATEGADVENTVKNIGVKAKAQIKGAVAEFESEIMDFGDVGPKSVHNFEYKFKNVGDEKLIISDVQSTCGCTVPDLAKKEYEPGEEGVIKVRYTAPAREGNTAKKLYVISNDVVNKRRGLLIKSNTVLKVSATPKTQELSLVDENAGMAQVVLKSEDGQEFAVIGVESAGNSVEIEFDKEKMSTKHVFTPHIDIAKLKENLNGFIKFQINHPECEEVVVNYTTLPEYSVSPARILFLKAEPGKTQEREIFVKSNYQDSIEIESVKSKKGFISIEKQEIKGAMAVLNVVLTAPELQGNQRFFTDSLYVKVKGHEELEIKCSGWFKKI